MKPAVEEVPEQYPGQDVLIQGQDGPEVVKLQPGHKLVTLAVNEGEGKTPAAEKVEEPQGRTSLLLYFQHCFLFSSFALKPLRGIEEGQVLSLLNIFPFFLTRR